MSMAANKVLPMFMSDTTITVSPSFNSIVVAFGISVASVCCSAICRPGARHVSIPSRRCATTEPKKGEYL